MQKKSLSLTVLFLLSTLPLIGADEETEAYKSYMESLRESQLEEITERLKRLDTDRFLSATLNEKITVAHFLGKKHYFKNGNHYAHRESSLEQIIEKTNSPRTPFYHKTLLLFKEKLTEFKKTGAPLTNEIIETLFKECATQQFNISK